MANGRIVETKHFLLQLTGVPGSGKTTLATAIGQSTGAVVLDKDIIKSRMLEGDLEIRLAPLPESIAAPLHHAVHQDLARAILDQGFSVVLDGAAFFSFIRERGRAMAASAGANYLIIECVLPDLAILQKRIDAKNLMPSQQSVATLDGYDRPGTAQLIEPHLVIDTRRPLDECLAEALAYIRQAYE